MEENDNYAKFKNIRILVGLNVDDLIYELSQKDLDCVYQEDKFRNLFKKNQKKALEKENYDKEVDDSIICLQNVLEAKQIQIRIVRDKNCHAKFYLFTSMPKPSHTNNMQYCEGSLIVGSSNLTHNGLEKNYEVNLLTKESADINYALEEFNKLWEDSIEITKNDINECVKQSYLEILSPKDVYYKLLLTHFGESSLKTDGTLRTLFKDYIAYDYQIHAVQEGIEKLKTYNGFFLSDVVGLGKTLIASVIAKRCYVDNFITGTTLIIAPPALKSSWQKHFIDIDIANRLFSTHDSLHKITQEQREQIELIIIDESHNFRSSTSNRYKELENICKIPFNGAHKKIILLSATPQNNSPKDLANQVYLFCNRKNSGIAGLQDLEAFFTKIDKEFKKITSELKALTQQDSKESQKERDKQNKELESISNTLRDKLLSYIMIRRTRSDIEKLYKEDMQKQNLKFPTIENPKDLAYDLDTDSNKLASESIAFLSSEDNSIGKFVYARYLIFPNLTLEGQEEFLQQYGEDESRKEFHANSAERLSVMIQIILFKRFDSSIAAFKSTLQKQIQSYNALIAMFERDNIFLPKGDKSHNLRENLYEAALSDNDEDLEKFLENKESEVISLKSHHFKEGFLENLRSDKESLQHLLRSWEQIKSDPKIAELKRFLESKPNHKIVLFTEAATTARYLAKELIAYTILQIDANNREENEQKIKENFDANYPQEKQKDEFSIIITTDTLAEGINLHRANIIINYDTPYNSTRLMQRIGRINRIGTSFEKIHIYNFKPTRLADKIININAIASNKLQSFHYTLGEDSAIYDEKEIVESKNLYNIMQEKDKEVSKETSYIQDLRDFYKNHKADFLRIKSLPLKSRTIIESQCSKNKSFAYIQQAYANKERASGFYPYKITTSENLLQEPEVQECSFYDMADFLRENLNKRPLPLQDMSLHYTHIKAALESHKERIKPKVSLNNTISRNQKEEHHALSKIAYATELDSALRERLTFELKNNGNTKLAKKINALEAKNSVDLSEKLAHLAQELPPQRIQEMPTQCESLEFTQEPQIQISITTIPYTKEHK